MAGISAVTCSLGNSGGNWTKHGTIYLSVGPSYAHQPKMFSLATAMVTRVSSDELKAIGHGSIALVDGSGYIAEMAVYHELHCIVSVREACQGRLISEIETYPTTSLS